MTGVVNPKRAKSTSNVGKDDNDSLPNSTTAATTATTDGRGGVKFGTGVAYDDAYAESGGNGDGEYVMELPTPEEEERMLAAERDDETLSNQRRHREEMEFEDAGVGGASHPSSMANLRRHHAEGDGGVGRFDKSLPDGEGDDVDPFKNACGGSGLVNTRISDRESDYQKRRAIDSRLQDLVKEDGSIDSQGMNYQEIMKSRELQAQKKQKKENEVPKGKGTEETISHPTSDADLDTGIARRRRRRWDDSGDDNSTLPNSTTAATPTDETPVSAVIVSDSETAATSSSTTNSSRWDDDSALAARRRRRRWDETPLSVSSDAVAADGAPDATPLVASGSGGDVDDATPLVSGGASKWDETPLVPSSSTELSKAKKRSRWDATPVIASMSGTTGAGPTLTPGMSSHDATRALLTATPATPSSGFQMTIPPEDSQDLSGLREKEAETYGVSLQPSSIEMPGGLPHIKNADLQYFGKLMQEVSQEELSKEEQKERQISMLLLKIKSGTPPQRKTAMRQITDKARFLGAASLFNQVLPLLMSPTLEDQERHLLVKVIDRVLYKLDDLVRPYVQRILAVIEPLLIDEDYYARVEGREIISNLSKAAGLPTMIATMRPDIDNPDEYVRNTTSRAFAVVASALGVPSLLPFLKAVCQSRKSWQARHTGIKIVQQIAILMGCAVLPHLRDLVEIVSHGLTDEQRKIRTITALTVAALAESSYPYGIESFDSVIRPLWKGALEHHSKGLAAFLKAIGFIIPLMEENYAAHYTRLIMPILIREFGSPDEEMKRIVLRVVQQCVATAGVEPDYIRKDILPEFFRNFWVRRMALDRRNHKQVVETTVELANKVGCADVMTRIVDDLKDDSEPYRRMVMETMQKVMQNLGAGDVDERLEERLIDGMLYAFQEQAVENVDSTGSISAFGSRDSQMIMLDGFGAVVNALGTRCKSYLKQIAGTIKWRLNNKSATVRMQAADLIGRIAVVMKACGEDALMGHLGVVLYEYLGEEYPDVLGSILGALRSIVNVIGMTKMTPPIRDLLPRLTPILRNRHEKVQENCIDLVSGAFFPSRTCSASGLRFA